MKRNDSYYIHFKNKIQVAKHLLENGDGSCNGSAECCTTFCDFCDTLDRMFRLTLAEKLLKEREELFKEIKRL